MKPLDASTILPSSHPRTPAMLLTCSPAGLLQAPMHKLITEAAVLWPGGACFLYTISQRCEVEIFIQEDARRACWGITVNLRRDGTVICRLGTQWGTATGGSQPPRTRHAADLLSRLFGSTIHVITQLSDKTPQPIPHHRTSRVHIHLHRAVLHLLPLGRTGCRCGILPQHQQHRDQQQQLSNCWQPQEAAVHSLLAKGLQKGGLLLQPSLQQEHQSQKGAGWVLNVRRTLLLSTAWRAQAHSVCKTTHRCCRHASTPHRQAPEAVVGAQRLTLLQGRGGPQVGPKPNHKLHAGRQEHRHYTMSQGMQPCKPASCSLGVSRRVKCKEAV